VVLSRPGTSPGIKFFSYFFLAGGSLVSRGDSVNFLPYRYGLEGNIFIELFHLRGLLLVSDSSISRNFDRYLQRWNVTAA